MPYSSVTVGIDSISTRGPLETAASIAAAHDAQLVIAMSYQPGPANCRAHDALRSDEHAAAPGAAADSLLHDTAAYISRKHHIKVVERFVPCGMLYKKLLREANPTNLVILPRQPLYLRDILSTTIIHIWQHKWDNTLFVTSE